MVALGEMEEYRARKQEGVIERKTLGAICNIVIGSLTKIKSPRGVTLEDIFLRDKSELRCRRNQRSSGPSGVRLGRLELKDQA
jgi:hypothetical protein